MKTSKYIEEEQTGKNGLQLTTWAYCWRCGERIPYNHGDECRFGVHKNCDTTHLAYADNAGKLELNLGA